MLLSYKVKNRLIKLISCLILSKKSRHEFKDKYLYITYPNDNHIFMILSNGKEKEIKHKIKGLKVNFIGRSNTLKINRDKDKIEDVEVIFLGDNSTAIVNNHTYCELSSNCFYSMDKTSYTCGSKIRLDENNSKIVIGKKCAISWDTEFMAADYHTILDAKGSICNMPKPIEIKDHVWIGCGVKICKGVTIAEDNIVGMGSVVTKSFLGHNYIIAGNPAKIVKRNVNWDVARIKNYVKKHPEVTD